jgi:hypothetical protein
LSEVRGRFCSFEVPEAWLPDPPCGAGEPLPGDERATVLAFERFLPRPSSPAEAARELLRGLPDLFEECQLLSQGPAVLAEGREGFALAFRYRDEEGDLRRQRRVYSTSGLYVCELVAELPDGSTSCPEHWLDAIVGSLRLRGVEFCAGARPLDLGRLDEPVGDAGGPRQDYPFLGRSLVVPTGWEVADGGDGVLVRGRGAELGVQRVMGCDGDASEWFAARMAEAATTGELVLGSSQWEDDAGRELASILLDDRTRRTWQSGARRQSLEVFTGEPVPAVFRLMAEPARMDEARPALLALIGASRPLPPEQWRTRAAEGWLDLVLAGGWHNPARGAYLLIADRVVTLSLLAQPTPSPLAVLAGALQRGARQGLSRLDEETAARGPLRGIEALSVRLTGVGHMGDAVVVQGLWLVAGDVLYTCLTQGADLDLVDRMQADAAAGLRLPGMEH